MPDLTVALIGNPNSGKTTLFNLLTGLNQKTGNFPGVTVDKKTGTLKLPDGKRAELVDLPGTYSIYPKTLDEQIVQEVLLDEKHPQHPDVIVVVADASNLKRNLLLFTQIRDLNIPCLLVLNMIDVAEKRKLKIDLRSLSIDLGVKIIPTNSRSGDGISLLKQALTETIRVPKMPFYNVRELADQTIDDIRREFSLDNDYRAYQLAQQNLKLTYLGEEEHNKIEAIKNENGFYDVPTQSKETLERYALISDIIDRNLSEEDPSKRAINAKIDRVTTHPIFGYAIFLGLLLLIFQAIFAWSEAPMTLIEDSIAGFGDWVKGVLPEGIINDLLTDGIIAGLAGVLVFIPQIAILFGFIAIMEESGYMSRAVFLMDKLMRKFGLNGKSVVPLISGMACAIPAIMATRNIDGWKDRLITIFVTPFMSCSARLPVYTILIGLVVPNEPIWGFFNLQGLVLMGLYLLGFLAAILSAWVMGFIVKAKHRGYFVMELPSYKVPKWKNVGLTIYEKTGTFVLEAGKVIIAISIILWVMASYGFGDKFENAEENVKTQLGTNYTEEEYDVALSAYKLEHSMAGSFGKFIEPTIEPLGYDWKIGIALITSFAAREVFVGTMSTIYSIGAEDDDEVTIRERLRQEINPKTGEPMYNKAVGFSLMVFYAFAMQCMSTLAIVYRETKGWKWPIIQTVYMSAVAYISAFIAYNIFS
ncbi:ferrous iron transport protein B [Roseivirga pacifica]|uniref:ferrous iron transport protein B n=1 Tax=Roseivirga pacifica TaxID=1267423 RepID=UPI00209516C3|nr:ferrous iron transport protein B [Roseivirga pacifica]MCO6365396.1 ferrous iron transport protein B [Roseivirga pacifica]MCO6371874.1 ferrous iron transport protein B [Roseivirga pacifica]MCO6376015.1 ferrous iron transport protein B [Roseivirga pacifica]MCO6379252.1 ferrous iron transport protein B [Roseivirga pacifica]